MSQISQQQLGHQAFDELISYKRSIAIRVMLDLKHQDLKGLSVKKQQAIIKKITAEAVAKTFEIYTTPKVAPTGA
jgi:hypothetical protein